MSSNIVSMENGTFVPSGNHHMTSSPSLVIFSQSAASASLSEALRLHQQQQQRPLHSHPLVQPPQMNESGSLKELQNPFSAGFPGLRHMEMYNGLQAQILHHLPPQFLHPGLSFGPSGPFRTLIEPKGFSGPSAFAPPSKCQNENTSSLLSNHSISSIFSTPEDRQYLGRDSASPGSVSSSPTLAGMGSTTPRPGSGPGILQNSGEVKQEELDLSNPDGERKYTPGPENPPPSNEMDHRRAFQEYSRCFGQEFGRLLRGREENGKIDTLYASPPASENSGGLQQLQPRDYAKGKPGCPVCGIRLEPGELDSHFVQELERLCKLSHSASRQGSSGPRDVSNGHRWETFQRVRNNRQDRLRVKSRKRRLDPEVPTSSCPACGCRMLRGTREEFSMHIAECLGKHKGLLISHTDEDETVDVEGDAKGYCPGEDVDIRDSSGDVDIDVEEDSEWSEQDGRRVLRKTSSTSLTTAVVCPATPTSSGTEEDSIRGITAEDNNDEEELVVDGDDPRVSTHAAPRSPSSKGVQQSQVSTVNSSGDVDMTKDESDVTTSGAESGAMLAELRARIRELERRDTSDEEEFRCFVCSRAYKSPLISTTCWHVHCQDCWTHFLGTKGDECPQCGLETNSKDLRIIYM